MSLIGTRDARETAGRKALLPREAGEDDAQLAYLEQVLVKDGRRPSRQTSSGHQRGSPSRSNRLFKVSASAGAVRRTTLFPDPPRHHPRLEERLRTLLGLHAIGVGRALNMGIIEFDPAPSNTLADDRCSDFALHLQCPFRITYQSRVILGSADLAWRESEVRDTGRPDSERTMYDFAQAAGLGQVLQPLARGVGHVRAAGSASRPATGAAQERHRRRSVNLGPSGRWSVSGSAAAGLPGLPSHRHIPDAL
ncbi:hypothetical protein ACBR40_20385 [Nonomuraea sp. AD125B]|uniref:hypothetical protein n=1 Tax=Nonomuraea sp. AD125B TaxID=3242897 RepID=UPI003527B91E